MKKLLPGLVSLLLTGLCITACTEDIDNLYETKTFESIDPRHLAIIESMGFSTEEIIEKEDRYVVEGDIAIRKEYMSGQQPQTRQARHEHVTNGREEDIRVSSVGLQGGAWEPAIRDALQAWNDIPNCPVYFRFVGNWAGDVFVRTSSGLRGSDAIAEADVPWAGRPGFEVRINPDYNGMTREEKTYVMVHEFGHIIGMAHTDMITNNPAWHIWGTPDWDAGQRDYDSVMKSSSGGRRWGAWAWDAWGSPTSWNFTTGDIAAIQAMYGNPIWSREIIGPATTSTISQPTYTLDLETNLINLEISWYVNDVLKQTGSSFSFTPTSLPLGQVTLKAVIHNKREDFQVNNKVITVANPITGPDAPLVNSNAFYSVPEMPSGINFTGWTVTGGAYTTTGGQANHTLNIRFNAETQYTLIANFSLADGTTHEVQKVINVAPFSIAITGPERCTMGNERTYSIPSGTLPNGITFVDWSIPGKRPGVDYQVYAGTAARRTMRIAFLIPGEFDITLNLVLRDGTRCSLVKRVIAFYRTGHIQMNEIPVGTNIRGWAFQIINSAYFRPTNLSGNYTLEVNNNSRYPLVSASLPNTITLNATTYNDVPITSYPAENNYKLYSSGQWLIPPGFIFVIKDDADYIVTRNNLPANINGYWGFDDTSASKALL